MNQEDLFLIHGQREVLPHIGKDGLGANVSRAMLKCEFLRNKRKAEQILDMEKLSRLRMGPERYSERIVDY